MCITIVMFSEIARVLFFTTFAGMGVVTVKNYTKVNFILNRKLEINIELKSP